MSAFWRQGGGWFVAALVCAVADWYAVARKNKRLEYVFKPAALALLLVGAWRLAQTPGVQTPGSALRLARWFLPALAFSLAGDVFLMLPLERYFIPGLLAFFAAHVCYIVGLTPAPPPTLAWLLVPVVAGVGTVLYRQIAAGLVRRGERHLRAPVAAYATILSLMLFTAWATALRPLWPLAGRALILVGATLFYASDLMLAWNLFVQSTRLRELLVIVTYHLAQVALAASIYFSS